MKINISDIKEKQFNKVMRGYDPEEVKAFLENLCSDIEGHLNEHEQLKSDLEKALSKINEFKKIEISLRNTLLKANETSSQSLDNAKKQAEQIVKEAEEKAAQIIEKAQEESESVRSAVISLKEERNMIVARLKAIINSQAALLEMKVESIEKERPLPKRLNENEMFEFNIDELIEKLL